MGDGHRLPRRKQMDEDGVLRAAGDGHSAAAPADPAMNAALGLERCIWAIFFWAGRGDARLHPMFRASASCRRALLLERTEFYSGRCGVVAQTDVGMWFFSE